MLIQLQNISKHYKNPQTGIKLEVLKNISLNINNGESIAIIGPSGSGKSTLLNIMGTLDNPSSGTASINGTGINHLNDNQLADIRNKDIGFVFQMHHLLNQLNLLENVLLPTIPLKDHKSKKETSKRAMDLLASVGLLDKIHQRPAQLSGGECQRAAVVRALINKPQVILADEPTGSLDTNSAKQLGDILTKLNSEHQVALVVVTHSQKLANKINTVYELLNGNLILKTL